MSEVERLRREWRASALWKPSALALRGLFGPEAKSRAVKLMERYNEIARRYAALAEDTEGEVR